LVAVAVVPLGMLALTPSATVGLVAVAVLAVRAHIAVLDAAAAAAVRSATAMVGRAVARTAPVLVAVAGVRRGLGQVNGLHAAQVAQVAMVVAVARRRVHVVGMQSARVVAAMPLVVPMVAFLILLLFGSAAPAFIAVLRHGAEAVHKGRLSARFRGARRVAAHHAAHQAAAGADRIASGRHQHAGASRVHRHDGGWGGTERRNGRALRAGQLGADKRPAP
jgi:hypothetical protein